MMTANITKERMKCLLKTVHNSICTGVTTKKQNLSQMIPLDPTFSLHETRRLRNVLYNSMEIKLAKSVEGSAG